LRVLKKYDLIGINLNKNIFILEETILRKNYEYIS